MKTNIKTLWLIVSVFGLAIPAFNLMAQEQVYGWELMSKQERNEHRKKMQSMKTMEERERYRLEHHKKMQQRAEQQGVTLPDKPQPRGKGMGRDGQGRGMGGGQGMGRGQGR